MNTAGQRILDVEPIEPLPPIVRYPDPRLLSRCRPVTAWSDELGRLIAELSRAVRGYRAAGMAAPQIGSDLRVLVLRLNTGAILPMVNPEIVGRSEEADRDHEGCLSLPGVKVSVPRHVGITVEYDTPLERKQIRLQGFNSRVVQHEVDHLDGVLLWDRCGLTERRLLQRAYAKKASRYESPEAMARRVAGLMAGETSQVNGSAP